MRNVFIEAIKLYSKDSQECDLARVKDTLWICLDMGLRMLHPFMPYLTEELWQHLPQTGDSYCREGSIMISGYPSVVKVIHCLKGVRDLLVPDFLFTWGNIAFCHRNGLMMNLKVKLPRSWKL